MNINILMNKRSIIAWCFYDWANSAYAAVILTFVFAVYYTEEIAVNSIIGTAHWGYMVAISGLLIASLSPVLGAVVDHQGRRKPWVLLFTCIAILATAVLWFSTPEPSSSTFTLFAIGLGLTCVEIAMVFYNAMLKDISPPHYIGRISGWAWGLGYVGGLLCLLIALYVFIEGKPAWLDAQASQLEQVRICGPLVAIWFFIFSIPLFIWTPEHSSEVISLRPAMMEGMRSLVNTFRALKHHKQIGLFLIAHLMYIDGLNTLFAFGGIYAAGTFGMSVNEVIKFGISMNLVAGIGAATFAYLDDYLGSKPTILLALLLMMIAGISMLFVETKYLFWLLGLGLSFCVGPVQAGSRTLLTRLVPDDIATQMFGMYALSGKVTTFIGPWLVAWATVHFNSQRLGVSTVFYFLLAGAVLLCFVREKNG